MIRLFGYLAAILLLPLLGHAQLTYGDAGIWKGTGIWQGTLQRGDSTIIIFKHNNAPVFRHRLRYMFFEELKPIHISTDKESIRLERVLKDLERPVYYAHDGILSVLHQGEFVRGEDGRNGFIPLLITDFPDFPRPFVQRKGKVAQIPVAKKHQESFHIFGERDVLFQDSVYRFVLGTMSFTEHDKTRHLHITLLDEQYQVFKEIELPINEFSVWRNRINVGIAEEYLRVMNIRDSTDAVSGWPMDSYTFTEISLRDNSVRTVRIESSDNLRLASFNVVSLPDASMMGFGIYQDKNTVRQDGLFTCRLLRQSDGFVIENERKEPFSASDQEALGRTPVLNATPVDRRHGVAMVNIAPEDSPAEMVVIIEFRYWAGEHPAYGGMLIKRLGNDGRVLWTASLQKKQKEILNPSYNSFGYFSSYLSWYNGNGLSILYNDHPANLAPDSVGIHTKTEMLDPTGYTKGEGCVVRADFDRTGKLTQTQLISASEIKKLKVMPSIGHGLVRRTSDNVYVLLIEPAWLVSHFSFRLGRIPRAPEP